MADDIVVADDNSTENEELDTLSAELGGYQALVMLIAVPVVFLIVFLVARPAPVALDGLDAQTVEELEEAAEFDDVTPAPEEDAAAVDEAETDAEAAEETADEAAETSEEAVAADVEPNVYFANLADGDVVTSPFTVEMAADGLIVEASGPVNEGAGHMHILINEPFVEEGVVIPANETHLHYGDGSSEAQLDLEPGEYTLRLQFANGLHEAFAGETYTDEVTITIADPAETGSA